MFLRDFKEAFIMSATVGIVFAAAQFALALDSTVYELISTFVNFTAIAFLLCGIPFALYDKYKRKREEAARLRRNDTDTFA